MAKYRMISFAEFYTYVEADSPEEAVALAKKNEQWFRTMNKSFESVQVESEVEKD